MPIPRALRLALPRALGGALAVLALGAAGCQPEIGDSCDVASDCSPNGGRVCDTASPGGYCTIQGCDPNGCPDRAVCVEWRYEANRTSETWCMKRCSSSSDCDRGGYRCVREDDMRLVDDQGEALARVIDIDGRADDGFCVYLAD